MFAAIDMCYSQIRVAIHVLVAASVVDHQLESYLRSHGVDQSWGLQERILVCITPRSNAVKMLESGRRNADRFRATTDEPSVTGYVSVGLRLSEG